MVAQMDSLSAANNYDKKKKKAGSLLKLPQDSDLGIRERWVRERKVRRVCKP